MSKIHIIVSKVFAVSLLFCSCLQELQEFQPVDVPKEAVQYQEYTLSATLGDSDAQTKTGIDGSSVLWLPGDEISLFYGSGSDGGSKFTSTNSEPSSNVDFTGMISVITGGNENTPEEKFFWGVYPYRYNNSCDGSSVTTMVPSVQMAVDGSLPEEDAFTMIGRSRGLAMGFYNLCGGLKFVVHEPGISRIEFCGNNGEYLAGTVKAGFDGDGKPEVQEYVDCQTSILLYAPEGGTFTVGETYYLVTLPTEFTKSMKMTFYKENGSIGIRKWSTQNIKINRSKFMNFTGTPIDANVQFDDTVDLGVNVLWATFNIGATNPADAGDYFAWGETTPKDTYKNNNYFDPGDVMIWPSYDAAYSIWGGRWRIPSVSDFRNLLDNTTRQWIEDYNGTGVSGYLLTSTVEGYTDNSVFFPVTGYINGGAYSYRDSDGFYRTADKSRYERFHDKYFMDIVASTTGWNSVGMAVRPVQDVHATDMWLSTSLTDDDERVTSLETYTGLDYCLEVHFDEERAFEAQELNWYATNPDIISFDESDGSTFNFRCIAPGTTTINVYAKDYAFEASCTVTVYEPHVMMKTSSNVYVDVPPTVFPLAADGRYESPGTDRFKMYCLRYDGTNYESFPSGTDIRWTFDPGVFTVANYDDPGIKLFSKTTNGEKNLNVQVHIGNDGSVQILDKDININLFTQKESTAIDLGLSIKWASYNLGATRIENDGTLFAWGETDTKESFTSDNYAYNHNSDAILPYSADAARAIWGGNWRTPTSAEWRELIENTTQEWTEYQGRSGWMLTSTVEGYTNRSLFLPAIDDTRYQSSSPGSYDPYNYGATRNESKLRLMNFVRYCGQLIRPVLGLPDVQSVTINGSQTVKMGGTTTLTAKVLPINAVSKEVVWSVENALVASVDQHGVVTGLTPGITTVQAVSVDGVHSDTHQITVTQDVIAWNMNLPSGNKWADRNIGATLSYDEGVLYAWGETATKSSFEYDNYTGSQDIDIATLVLGPGWRTPSKADWEELLEYCNVQNNYQHNSISFKLKSNPLSVLELPFARMMVGNYVMGGYDSSKGYGCGYFWTRTIYPNDGTMYGASVEYDADFLPITAGLAIGKLKYYGMAIRAVYNPAWVNK